MLPALALRSSSGIKDERQFLDVRNWRALVRQLGNLGLTSDAGWIQVLAVTVARAWVALGDEQLDDARHLAAQGRGRATFSRAYYAAYNFSKAIRYFANGTVSLRGDDHQKVGDLPDGFPNVATWTTELSELYQHRLRADYDGWSLTSTQFTITPTDAVAKAEQFRTDCETFLRSKFGVLL